MGYTIIVVGCGGTGANYIVELGRYLYQNTLASSCSLLLIDGDVVEEKNGKKVLVQRKSMPCYILVKIKYADDLWHNITRTRGITGFVGPNGRPLPLKDEDIIRLRLEKIKVDVDLSIGDRVEIVEGALNGQIGEVTAIDKENGQVTVKVEMFNRETQVDVQLSQVRRIN